MEIAPFFVFIHMDFNDIVEKFNNGDLEVTKYFNDYETFFSILKKRGLMSEIDPNNATDSEEWQNEYLLWLYHNDSAAFDKWVPSLLNDVVYKDGVYYLDVDDRGELSKLFCDGRNDISRSTIEGILSGESDWDPYWNTTDDVYRDVVEELNEDNLKLLGEYIVSNLEGKEIEPETELLSDIAKSQGTENPTINYENVAQVINDEETLKYLWDTGLPELHGELYSIHNNAYNNAYEDTVWESVWDELSTYFIGRGEWVSRPHRYKKDTEVQHFVIPIANFESDIVKFLEDNKGYGNTGTLEYWGSYIDVLKEWADCLSVHSPDYPDFQKVDKNINELFPDYI
jgi:hypothetical protein